jgi:hypothetical protein
LIGFLRYGGWGDCDHLRGVYADRVLFAASRMAASRLALGACLKRDRRELPS